MAAGFRQVKGVARATGEGKGEENTNGAAGTGERVIHAKVLVVKYGYNMLIRWVTYRWSAPREDRGVTGPDDVFLAAFVCRRLPRSPDPDPGLT